MNLRETEFYKRLTPFTACEILAYDDGVFHNENNILSAWQYIADTGLWRHLDGWFGETVSRLIDEGKIKSTLTR